MFLIVNYVIYGCCSARATPGAYHWSKNIAAVITQDKVIYDNLKMQIKNWSLHTCSFVITNLNFSVY